MTPQELKASILQLAIQGKLVEQRPEEGTAEELYKQIQEEKKKLIKAGKIKKGKPLPEITVDEIPFDIPESWKHVKLGEVFCFEMGQSPDGNTVSETGDGIEFHQGKVYFGKMELQLSPQKTTSPTKYAQPNSALLCVRAPVGKVNITKRKVCIGRGLCAVKPICGISVEFVYYWLATLENTFIKKATGTTFVAITGEVIKNQVIPLPPLTEQKRIVAKIEELLPLIDRYEKAWNRLEDLNKRFPADMQKSILQMAIQGKLVEQRPEEGTAEELYKQIQKEKKQLIKAGKIKKGKSLPEITEDEIPFDIPESWKWVRLGNVCWFQGGYAYKSTSYVHDSRNQIIRLGNVKQNQLLLDTKPTYIPDSIAEVTEAYLIKKNDILVTMTGTRRKKDYLFVTRINDADLAERKLYINQRVGCFRVIDHRIESEYLQRVLQSEAIRDIIFERETGTANQGNLGSEDMKMYIYVPLPPLAEQKRIVAKLEEILPMCDKLK